MPLGAEDGAPLAGVVVAVPFDLEDEALDTLEFGLPAEALGNLGNVDGMPVFAYLFRTQVWPSCRLLIVSRRKLHTLELESRFFLLLRVFISIVLRALVSV